MTLDLKTAQFTAAKLLRAGESKALTASLDAFGTGHNEAWEALLERRFNTFISIRGFDHLPVGWHHAACRLYGDDAEAGLMSVQDRRDWPGPEEAEATLLRHRPATPFPPEGGTGTPSTACHP
jgi:hypothetical protein